MTKEKFLQLMQTKRNRWTTLLDQIANEDRNQPGVDGDWSVRDLIIHVTAYEDGLVEWLDAATKGDIKTFPILDHEDLDYRNLKILQEKEELSFDQAQAVANDVFERLMALIDTISEEELLDPDKTEWYVEPRWKQKRALRECIADDSFRHYEQHMGNVQQWLEQKNREIE